MTLLERARDWVTGDEFPVLLTGIALAVPVAYVVPAAVDGPDSLRILFLLALGAGVPRLYRHWPRSYGRLAAVGWAVAACAVMTVEMVALYVLFASVAGDLPAAVGAFLLADLGNVVLLSLTGDATSN